MESTGSRFRVCVHRAHGGYYARVIEIPGCIARGATEVEAIENLRGTLRAFLRVAQVLASDRPTVDVEITA
ncbi:MAG TPA: type II toxin-antitoxin system HicB family antitoxin [Usitatibacter sp.]|nr:type II toxin-antitoxin system HicB family antitoxin [Usitatibacter sp.]